MIDPRITITRTAARGEFKWKADFNLYKLGPGGVWIDLGCVSAQSDTPETAIRKLKNGLGGEWPETVDGFTTPEKFASYRKHVYQEEYDEQPSVAFGR